MHNVSAVSMPQSSAENDPKDRRAREALIALGGNVAREGRGVEATLADALAMLEGPDIHVAARSGWYRTPAYPAGSGPDFVNAAARLETGLDPRALLLRLHEVEAAMGRARSGRWEPRVCDLDLLAMGDETLPDTETVRRWMAMDLGTAQSVWPERLILPHPRMQERAFVLVPLADIAPGWRHPVLGRSVAEMVAALPEAERAAIRRLS